MNTLAIVQPLLPKYRIPFFHRLGEAMPDTRVIVLADLETVSQLNQVRFYDQAEHAFEVMHVPLQRRGPFIFRPGLRKMLSALQPDAVVLEGNPRQITIFRLARWLKRRSIPVAFWSMFYRIGPKRQVAEWQMAKMGRLGDRLFSYGERGLQEQVARGTPRDKIIVLYNSIDQTPIFEVRDGIPREEVEAFREREALAGKRVLLHVVRLTAIKRADRMVEAFKRLAGRRDDVLLIFIGGGALEDEIKQQVEDAGLQERVRFLGPIYDEQQLARWYLASDVFVMATCIGLSIHHAMAYGVPVITDDNPRTQTAEFEVLEDGVNGLTYAAGDLDDFASKIDEVLTDDALRTRLSEGATHHIEHVYTLERMADQMRKGVEQLFAQRPG